MSSSVLYIFHQFINLVRVPNLTWTISVISSESSSVVYERGRHPALKHTRVGTQHQHQILPSPTCQLSGQIVRGGRHHRQKLAEVGAKSDVGANVGINVGANEKKILTIIANTPNATAREMAEAIDITQRQCERILAKLKQEGIVVRIGATKNGHWEILNN